MLTPPELERSGEQEERRASSVVDGIVALLARMAVEAFAAGDEAVPSAVEIPQQVLAYLAAHPIERPAEVERTVEGAERESRRNDARAVGLGVTAFVAGAIGSAMGGSGGRRPMSNAEAIEREVRAFLRRANLNMADSAKRTYREVVARNIRRYKAGMVNYETAMQDICRDIARAGVQVVDYKSGRWAQADVACRRHVQTMVRKAADERTLDDCKRLGYQLVEVSSHGGARPSHRKWQGRVYSLVGDIEIDGVRYRDFYSATGYGSVDGLGGANCRHSFAPYTPGRPRRWSETPDEDAGHDPDEFYKLTQRQRANERRIREAKRNVMACREAGVDDTRARLALGRAQKAQRDFMAAHPSLQRRSGREQVYGADGASVRVSALKRRQVATSERASKERDDRVANDMPNDVNRAAQRKHVKGSKEYEEKSASMRAKGSPYPAPSYLTIDEDEAERLVKRHAGGGVAKAKRDGSWSGQEVCTTDRVIGYIVKQDGTEVPTRSFKIHYSKRGTHIVPFDPNEEA